MINENSSRDEVLAAVRQNGYALEYASKDLRADKEVVLAAVKQKGWAIHCASEDLRKDKKVVLAAVRQKGCALKFSSEDLRKDKEVVLEAVKEDGFVLRFALGGLREDKEVVLAAVKQTGYALQFASDPLKADKEVVLAAVQQDSWALHYLPANLSHHPLLTSIAEETKCGKQQNISYKLFCFVEKNPELYKLGFLTSNEMRSACNSQNVVSSGNTHQFVFNFARHQLDNSNFANQNQQMFVGV